VLTKIRRHTFFHDLVCAFGVGVLQGIAQRTYVNESCLIRCRVLRNANIYTRVYIHIPALRILQHTLQGIAERKAARLDCGNGKFVGGAIQHKRQFFQVRKLPEGKSFPWPVSEKSEARRRRSLGSADFVGGGGAVGAWARQGKVESVFVPEWGSELGPVDGPKVDCTNARGLAHKLSPSADSKHKSSADSKQILSACVPVHDQMGAALAAPKGWGVEVSLSPNSKKVWRHDANYPPLPSFLALNACFMTDFGRARTYVHTHDSQNR